MENLSFAPQRSTRLLSSHPCKRLSLVGSLCKWHCAAIPSRRVYLSQLLHNAGVNLAGAGYCCQSEHTRRQLRLHEPLTSYYGTYRRLLVSWHNC